MYGVTESDYYFNCLLLLMHGGISNHAFISITFISPKRQHTFVKAQ